MSAFLIFLSKLAARAGQQPLTLTISPTLAVLIVAFLAFLWIYR